MSNPARQLLTIFDEWAAIGGSTHQSRAPQDPSGIDKVIRAVDLVAQIRRQLDALAARGMDVEIYRGASDEWARSVIAFNNGWNAADPNGTINLYNQGRMDMLGALALYFDGLPPAINEGQLTSLREYLDQVSDMLATDATIDDALRAYIHNLLNEIRAALDRYDTGFDFDAADAVERLWVGLKAASGSSKSHKKSWDGLAVRIFAPAASSLLASAPMLAIEAFKLTTGTQ